MTPAELDQVKRNGGYLRQIVSRKVKLNRNGEGCCPFHEDTHPSFGIYEGADKHWRYKCHGCDAKGTVVDYLMKDGALGQAETFRQIESDLGFTNSTTKPQQKTQRKANGNGADHAPPEFQPMVPPPKGVVPPASDDPLFDGCTPYEYVTAGGRLGSYQRRYEATPTERKEFRPLTYGTLIVKGKPVTGWHDKAPNVPRALFRLESLMTADPDTIVIVVEGEKAALAAERLFPNAIVTTWMNGANAVHLADWNPLRRFKTVIWWADADQPKDKPHGCFIATPAFRKLFPEAKLVDTAGLEQIVDGYDAADLESDGCDDPDAWLKERLRDPPPDPETEPTEAPVLQLRYGFDSTIATAAGTVVEGVLHAGSVSLIYGAPKSGKSFLATDLSMTVPDETQDEWMGHVIVRHGSMLYVACEGHAGFWKRSAAAAKERGWDRDSFPKGFILATGRPVLIRADARGLTYAPDPSAILAALDDAKVRGLDPVGIVIDTVFRAFGTGNVNASPDMNAFLACVAVLTDQGYAVALVHHEVKSGGSPAGSVALMGGSDTIINVWRKTEQSEERFWQVEMAKDDAETKPRGFTLKVVQLGRDLDGRPASSCVVVDGGPAPGADGPRKRGRPASPTSEGAVLADLVHRELCNLLADPTDGTPTLFNLRLPPVRAIQRVRLLDAVIKGGIMGSQAPDDDRKKLATTRRKAFNKALTRLKENRKVLLTEDWAGVPTNAAS